ncbi:MAG TPA: class I SAM-dependent methyltransferase, partial [Luteolibacter sp.]
MPLIDHLFSVGLVRKAIWKLWYPFLTRRLHGEEVVFLNYAFETDPPMAIPLALGDESNRACIQLYHHVGSQVNFRRKDVLEVSCGHGGGAAYLARTMEPAKYIGLDLNASGVAFCKKRHLVPGLDFVQGDAENLPFPDAS